MFPLDEEKIKGKKRVMAMKLDMSKVYDRLEWGFITKLLATMGFSDHVVNLIKSCISMVSYKVLISGQPSMSFFPKGVSVKGTLLRPICFSCVPMFFQGF